MTTDEMMLAIRTWAAERYPNSPVERVRVDFVGQDMGFTMPMFHTSTARPAQPTSEENTIDRILEALDKATGPLTSVALARAAGIKFTRSFLAVVAQLVEEGIVRENDKLFRLVGNFGKGKEA